eukprot:CAMPEP_0182433034 /NCGR_PEP_ID=MMETSP1167-20130531/60331_1 /TAXON_ID=2988 /ORGANISM="Mallomonas Sp, Strain CCMP3275" /LENGTH=263 /DNA_ID=CAMNT_0024621209 /DNA_START=274 /DNA_END=1066 /DNA_ORIENTATION=-
MERASSMKGLSIQRADSFTDIDDEELQRKELIRLLETAQDAERIKFIQNALMVLDKDRKEHTERNGTAKVVHGPPSPGKGTLAVPPFFKAGSGKALFDGHYPRPSSAQNRPTSAHMRRPSNLDVIPEHRMLPFKSRIQEREESEGEICLSVEHVKEIVASCEDPVYPPLRLFNDPSNDRAGASWICTGLCPQILSIRFHFVWTLKKVEIETTNVSSLSVSMADPEQDTRFSLLSTTRVNDTFTVVNEALCREKMGHATCAPNI